MDADERREKLDGVTRAIIGAARRVSMKLGCGFLEKVYENALAIELGKARLPVEQAVIVEAKAVQALDEVHQAQCMNYLKATGLSVCLLLNFGVPKLQVKRFVSGF